MDLCSIESMVKDGIFGDGSACGMGYGEHLVLIHLRFRGFEDQFEWDICNPDNQPEEFAAQIVADMHLIPSQDYEVAISYEIRKQIM